MTNETRDLVVRLMRLSKYIDYEFLLEESSVPRSVLSAFYKHNHLLFYRVFASKAGYMHIGLSDDGVYRKNSHYEEAQLKYIEDLLYQTRLRSGTVLELGSGQGANLAYLAKRHPEINFLGMDIAPSTYKTRHLRNTHIIQADYHDLSCIADNSIDLIYAIETLCYPNDLPMVFKQIHRKLRTQGKFIVFDYYCTKPRDSLNELECVCLRLLENAHYIDGFHMIAQFTGLAQCNGFMLEHHENLSAKAMPYLQDIDIRINRFFKLGPILNIFLRFYPKDAVRCMIPGYLMSALTKYGVGQYYYQVLSKSNE